MALQGYNCNISTPVDVGIVKSEPLDPIVETLGNPGMNVKENPPCDSKTISVANIKREPFQESVNKTESVPDVNSRVSNVHTKDLKRLQKLKPKRRNEVISKETKRARKLKRRAIKRRQEQRSIQYNLEFTRDQLNKMNLSRMEELKKFNDDLLFQHLNNDSQNLPEYIPLTNDIPYSGPSQKGNGKKRKRENRLVTQTENNKKLVNGEITKKNKKRKINESSQENSQKHTLLIKDIPHYLTYGEILEYFSRYYGRVVNYYFRGDNQYGIIQFSYYTSVTELLSQCVWIKGIKLEIKYLKNIHERAGIIQRSLKFKNINESIKGLPDFQTQLNKLMEKLQPSSLIEKYKLLCYDLQNIFREIFPGCVVFQIGDTNCGLGFTATPVDLHIEIKDLPQLSKKKNKLKLLVENCNQLLNNRDLVFLKLPLPTNLGKIECIHNPTELKCCLYVLNRQDVRMTSLIRFYLSLNSKLKPLVVIIKYWAKIHQLTDTDLSFTSYSLILLLIFYLQQNPFCLPLVKNLKTVEDSADINEFESDYRFCSSKHYVVSKSLSKCSIPEILHGFFDYYANFDYLLNIISPYLGKPVPKAECCNPELFGTKLFKQIPKSMCFLQNPLQIKNNTTRCVSGVFLKKFVRLCHVGAAIFKNHAVDHLALHKLFTNSTLPIQEYNMSNTIVHVKSEPLESADSTENMGTKNTVHHQMPTSDATKKRNDSGTSVDGHLHKTHVKSEPLELIDQDLKSTGLQSQPSYIFPLLEVQW